MLENLELFQEKAFSYSGLDHQYLELIKKCDNVYRINFTIQRENGKKEVITGYRAHHKRTKMPAIGGLRIMKPQSISDNTAMALLTSYQCAVCDIPFGGSSGGINVDFDNYSENEKHMIVSRYTQELGNLRVVGPGMDIISPEYGCSQELMDVMKEAYVKLFGIRD